MKRNIYFTKYILVLQILLSSLQTIYGQIIFKEDFGQINIRKTSPYVPQSGADSGLGTFSHGSAFYKFAEIITTNPWGTSQNEASNIINDGYYAVINPQQVYANLPAGKPTWATWWVNKPDHTGNTNGAVMIVNAGKIKNQFYRRAVALEKGKTYQISAYVMSSGTQSFPKFIFQAQNIMTEQSLGSSAEQSLNVGSQWKLLSWKFKIPNTDNCGNIAVALRNNSDIEQGNDFYVDDILLEEIPNTTADVIACSSSAALDNIIKANNDTYFLNNTGGVFNILNNDTYNNVAGNFIFSGTTKNATISTIGTWPTGYSISTDGKLIVAAGSSPPTQALQYQICNLIGVCSTATVTFNWSPNDVMLSGVVTNQCGYASNTNTYTLTIKNNSNVPITGSANEKITVKFSVEPDLLVGNGITFTSTTADNPKWTHTAPALLSNEHTFTLKNGIVIPADGSISIQFSKNWNSLTALRTINSLNIDLQYLNASSQNIDNNRSNNTLFISVFKTNVTPVPNVSINVNQLQNISIGEASGLGRNTSGYRFYLMDNTEVPSSYIIPTANNQPFQFKYKSSCDGSQVTVSVAIGFDNPGTIALAASPVCYGSVATVNATSSPSSTYYTWEASTDNGATWTEVSAESLTASNLTLSSVLSKTLVRRKARRLISLQYYIAYSNVVSIDVIDNKITYNPGNNFSIQKGGSINIPTITTSYPSTITIKKADGSVVSQGSTHTFATEGLYTFSVEIKTTGATVCTTTGSISVYVYDIKNCDEARETVLVKTQDWGTIPVIVIPGWVINNENAADADLSTYSTITIPVGLLGLGTTWQNLKFDHNVPAGMPVTVKIGQEYSGLQVAGGLTVQAIGTNGSTIGPLLAAGDGALLDLLVGDNVFEYSFVPKNSSGVPVAYSGVRIVVGSTLAVANNAKIFGAYYQKTKTVDINNPSCNTTGKVAAGASKPDDYVGNVTLNPIVDDVLWGVQDLGLGVASALASVVHPYLAVDNNLNSYAIFDKAVAVLNRQKLTVKLNQIARPGDQIRIIMGGFEVPVLDLSLLTAFKVQRYMGNIKVGPEVNGSQFKVLDLNLLSLFDDTGYRKALIVDAIGQPFDRIELSYLSTVQVGLLGDYTYIYDISIMPSLIFDGQNLNDPNGALNAIKLCAANYLEVTRLDLCTTYDISLAYASKEDQQVIGYTEIPSSKLTQVNANDATSNILRYEFSQIYPEHDGNLYLKVQAKRQGCPYGEVQYLKISLENCNQSVVNPVLRNTAH